MLSRKAPSSRAWISHYLHFNILVTEDCHVGIEKRLKGVVMAFIDSLAGLGRC